MLFKNLLAAFAFFVLFNAANAQPNQCRCLENLDSVIAKTERNYAGYPAKVNARNKNEYQQLKATLSFKAAKIFQPKPCFYILKAYVRFFYDRHFQLSYYNELDFDSEKIAISETAFIKQFNNKKRHELEGIWINQDSSLKIGIMHLPGQLFKAIVLDTKNPRIQKGQVYMTITPGKRGLVVKYYNSFSATDFPIRQKGNLLQGWSDDLFGKIFPKQMNAEEQRQLATWRNRNGGLDFYKLSPNTAVLKIPSFANNDDKIAALVQQHDAVIRSTPNLIVDLTGNGGGSTGWVSFLGYFMTSPIVQKNGYLRVSPENVQLKLADIEPYVTNPIPTDYQKYFPDSVLAVYKKAFSELPVSKDLFYPVPGVVFPLDSVTNYPKKIALVVDNLCGSSTEYFFYLSKSSAKTTTYGVNTFGMMDYEGASPTTLPYALFQLSIPIVKSSWTDSSPIDKTGFSPDVNLGHIKPENWIAYIRQKLEK
jgi:hypothetical protein